jgi:hypothetical protein
MSNSVILLCFVSIYAHTQNIGAAGAAASREGLEQSARREIMSSSLVSTVSSPPSVAAATPCHHRHDGGVKQLRVKPQQLLLHGGRAVVARAGPGPLTEIEPDLHEDAIDRWRTSGVSPVRYLTLSLGSLLASEYGVERNG